MKRTPMKRKRRKGDNVELRIAYLDRHSNCAICGERWLTFGNWIECHHLVGGSGRIDRMENFLTLCNDCHTEYHRGKLLTPGMLLTAKMQQDPDNFDIDVILKLLGRKGLPYRWIPCAIPEEARRSK